MSKNDTIQNILFVPEHIQNNMEQIFHFPLTVIKAPSGFGKTTAVMEVLKQKVQYQNRIFWYTCLGEVPERAWSSICSLFSNADQKAAAYLKKLTLPTMDTLGEISLIMDQMKCETNTVLIIDNFQLAKFSIQEHLLKAISLHTCPTLHIIVITQEIDNDIAFDPRIEVISQDELRFNQKDIISLFQLADIKLNNGQVHLLYDMTQGWIAALRLFLCVYLDTGRLSNDIDMDGLLHSAIWSHLRQDEKDFLISVSVLNDFTIAQAQIMMHCEGLPDRYLLLLSKTFLIYYNKETSIYNLHYLLKEYLLRKFELKSIEFQNELYQRAGQACTTRNQWAQATVFFVKSNDFESALDLPFLGEDIIELIHQDQQYLTLAISNSTMDFLIAHHQLLMRIGIKALVRAKNELFAVCYQSLITMSNTSKLQEEEKNLINSEIELIRSLLVFNDVTKMCEHHQAAFGLIKRPMNIHPHTDSWTSNVPSVVCMFWRKEEDLNITYQKIKEGMPCYYNITDGHGMGADEAMLGEIYLMRGDDQQAEIHSHRAIWLADQKRQDSIIFCAELTLCRIALFRGDEQAYQSGLDSIRYRVYEGSEAEGIITSDLCTAFLNTILEHEKKIPDWLMDTARIQNRLCSSAIPFAHIIFAQYKAKHHPMEFISIIDDLMQEAFDHHMVLPAVYYLIMLTVYHKNINQMEEAITYLNQALSIAIPNQVYLPFAEYFSHIEDLLHNDVIQIENNETIQSIKRIGKQFQKGVLKIQRYLKPQILTPREREIALLAKERRTAKEIANQLTLTVNTVNSTLKIIYSKLDIHSKYELYTKDF